MFSTTNLYNSACSNAVDPIRIHPITMSIILHHYKILKERTLSFIGFYNFSNIMMTIIFMTIIVTIQKY